MQNDRTAPEKPSPAGQPAGSAERPAPQPGQPPRVKEVGGPPGPEPTRYGDWEKGGRCIDF